MSVSGELISKFSDKENINDYLEPLLSTTTVISTLTPDFEAINGKTHEKK